MDPDKMLGIPINIPIPVGGKSYRFIRIILTTLLALFAIYLPKIDLFGKTSDHFHCIDDAFFNMTFEINRKLTNLIQIRETILILSSFCMDAIYIVFSYYWISYGRSWRVIIAFCSFYLFRSLIQNLFQMTYPPGMLWSYPGFPSMTISYLKTNDFFPSGHVAFPIIVGMEFLKLNKPLLFIICLFSALFETVVMVLMRGHYSIDLLAGWIFSHYFFMLSDQYSYILDDSRISMKEEEFEFLLERNKEFSSNKTYI
jgi:hypothetical protein